MGEGEEKIGRGRGRGRGKEKEKEEIINTHLTGRCENFFSFVKEWWPKRHNKNVLFLHFSEMKQDHEVFFFFFFFFFLFFLAL